MRNSWLQQQRSPGWKQEVEGLAREGKAFGESHPCFVQPRAGKTRNELWDLTQEGPGKEKQLHPHPHLAPAPHKLEAERTWGI